MNNSSFIVLNEDNESQTCSTNNSSEDNASNAAFMANTIIIKAVFPVFLCIGIPGNMLSMVLIVRQRKCLTFTSVTLFVVALMDNVHLMTSNLPDCIAALTGFDIRNTSSGVCQLFYFLCNASGIASAWGLVAITVERTVCVTWPHKARSMFTPKTSVVALACFIAVAVTVSAYCFVIFEVSQEIYDIYGFSCGTNAQMDSSDIVTFTVMLSLYSLSFLIPFVLMVIGNTTLVCKLSLLGINHTSLTPQKKKMRQLCVLVIWLNIIFFISQFPTASYVVSSNYIIDWVFSETCTEQFRFRLGVSHLLFTCCVCMGYINPSANFLLYVVSSTGFRREIKSLFRCESAGIKNIFAE